MIRSTFLNDENKQFINNIYNNRIEALKFIQKNNLNDTCEFSFDKNIVFQTVIKYLNNLNPNTILDLGCGKCELINYLSKKYKTFACDCDNNMKKFCKTNFKISFAENLRYENDFFDCVICTDVLEHVFSLSKTLKEIKRVLKHGGYLIAVIPYQLRLDYVTHVRIFNNLCFDGFKLINKEFISVYNFEDEVCVVLKNE